MILSTLALFGTIAAAEFSITDPSNVINPADWTADNAVLADYNITPTLYQTNAIEGAYVYSDQNATISRQYLTVDANDTSVLVISNGSTASISSTEIVKFGHGSNLFQESFYGKVVWMQHAQPLTIMNRTQCCSEYCQSVHSNTSGHQCHCPQWCCQHLRLWRRHCCQRGQRILIQLRTCLTWSLCRW